MNPSHDWSYALPPEEPPAVKDPPTDPGHSHKCIIFYPKEVVTEVRTT